jgi:hypothetical protein
MKPGEREWVWLCGYLSAWLVIWLAAEGIPRLLDYLINTEEPEAVVLPAPSENGKEKPTTADSETVVREAVSE